MVRKYAREGRGVTDNDLARVRNRNWILVIIVCLVLVPLVLISRRDKQLWRDAGRETQEAHETLVAVEDDGPEKDEGELGPSAGRVREYIEAIQARNFAAVFEMTSWMQERVAYLRAHSNDPDTEINRFIQEERRAFMQRPEVLVVLTADGVEDKYLVGCGTFRIESVEEDVSRPVLSSGKMLAEVTVALDHSECDHASLLFEGKAVESLTASFLVEPNGKIVKAGVKGNAEVVLSTVKCQKPA